MRRQEKEALVRDQPVRIGVCIALDSAVGQVSRRVLAGVKEGTKCERV